MTARIPSAEPPFSAAIQETLDRVMPKGVPPLALFTMLARDERLFSRFMGGGLLDKGHLALRHREIIIHRVTALCGSEYEWGVHAAFFQKKADLSNEELYSLVRGGPNDACWKDSADQLLIRMSDALNSDCTIGDELWNEARAVFSNEALLEIIMLAGFYRTVSYLTNATKLPLESFAERFPEKR